jgi:membrane protease YdiL (CAAX protease family)
MNEESPTFGVGSQPEEALSRQEPPLVLRVDAAETVISPRRPRPGLLEAVLWCVVFLLTQLTASLLVVAGVLAFFAWSHAEPWAFVQEQLAALAAAQQSPGKKAETADAPEESSPTEGAEAAPPAAVPREIALALVYGMLAAQVASWWLIRQVVPRVVGRHWKEQIGWRRPRAVQIFLVTLVIVPFMLLAGGLQELLMRLGIGTHLQIAESLRALFQHAPLVVTLAATAVGPGIVEEVWCRGFLGRGLIARYGLIPGVLWTSLLFGLLHMDPAYAVVTAAMGVYLHFVFLACRSLAAPIFLHTCNNGLAVLASLNPQVLPVLAADAPGLSLVSYGLAAAVLGGCSYALWRTRPRAASAL